MPSNPNSMDMLTEQATTGRKYMDYFQNFDPLCKIREELSDHANGIANIHAAGNDKSGPLLGIKVEFIED
jgi:hypothetical protein